MAKLNEEAINYNPPKVGTVADLEIVRTDVEVKEKTAQDKNGVDFTYKYIVVNEEEYRIPNSVLGSLKAILEIKPDLKTFKVTKTGTGLDTRYTLIPL